MTISSSDGSTFPRKGRINFADTRINPSTGTFEMRAEVANADGALKPGQFVRVMLQGAVRNNAIAVPQVAVLDGPQGKFVYVAGKDKDGKDVATPRPVVARRLGRRSTARTCGSSNRARSRRPGDRRRRRASCMPGAPIMLGDGGRRRAPGGAPPAAARPPAKDAPRRAGREGAAPRTAKSAPPKT